MEHVFGIYKGIGHSTPPDLNIISSMVITRYQYQPLKRVTFSSTELCGNILNIFWGGIITTKMLYKINRDT